MTYSDDFLTAALRDAKIVAQVGVSMNQVRPSYYVGRYLKLKGYQVLPVNPVYEGQELFGATIRGSLSDLADQGQRVEMVDIFRRSEEAAKIVDEALETLLDKGLKVIWMQIGVENHDAAKRAEKAGLRVIMNRCPKIEYQRLSGELSIGGFNSGRVSSKLRQLQV